jgi:hypothetical protein
VPAGISHPELRLGRGRDPRVPYRTAGVHPLKFTETHSCGALSLRPNGMFMYHIARSWLKLIIMRCDPSYGTIADSLDYLKPIKCPQIVNVQLRLRG